MGRQLKTDPLCLPWMAEMVKALSGLGVPGRKIFLFIYSFFKLQVHIERTRKRRMNKIDVVSVLVELKSLVGESVSKQARKQTSV